MMTHGHRSPRTNRRVLLWICAAGLQVLGQGCSIPIDTGLGAPKKPLTIGDATLASKRAYETGNPDQAKRLIRNAEDAARANPGEKPILAKSLSEIAIAQSERGNHIEAQELHERALKLREEAYGPVHYEVAESLTFLGASYYQTQRYRDAEKAFARALEIRKKILGPEDRSTGLSMNNLAFFYAALDRYDEADPLFRESIRILTNAEDASSGEKARALDNYAAMLLDAGRDEDAKRIQDQALTYKGKRNQVEDILRVTK